MADDLLQRRNGGVVLRARPNRLERLSAEAAATDITKMAARNETKPSLCMGGVHSVGTSRQTT